MGTGALVCISARKIVTQQASSGIGDTHCSVDKCLYFKIIWYIITQFSQFIQGKLPCRDNTACSLFVPEIICAVVRVIGLCTDMTFNLRTYFFCNFKNPRIRYDQAVRFYFLQFFKIRSHTGQIAVMRQYIGCNIDFYKMLMGKGNPFLHVFHREILGLCTKPESLSVPQWQYGRYQLFIMFQFIQIFPHPGMNGTVPALYCKAGLDDVPILHDIV